MRLLLVDDEDSTRIGLKKHVPWETLGISEVLDASSGCEGLTIAMEWRPQVIVTDIRMPGMNGIEFCRCVKNFLKDFKIIFISGYSDKVYLKAAIDLSAVAYVEKPIDLQEMSAAVYKAVGGLNPPAAFFHERQTESAAPGSHNVALAMVEILSRFCDPALTLQTVADKIHLTPTYLAFIFKSETGKTVGQFITQQRLEHAMELIKAGSMPLGEIAAAVGYSDAHYFTKAFKKFTGILPSQYRKTSGI